MKIIVRGILQKLSKQPSVPAYYIRDWLIFCHENWSYFVATFQIDEMNFQKCNPLLRIIACKEVSLYFYYSCFHKDIQGCANSERISPNSVRFDCFVVCTAKGVGICNQITFAKVKWTKKYCMKVLPTPYATAMIKLKQLRFKTSASIVKIW